MIGIELGCVAIVALYVAVRAPRDPSPRTFILRLLVLMVGSWVGENTVIHAYAFYAYSPEWSLFIDRVPVLIVTIWPVVIHSAWDLARRLCRRPAWVPFVGALLVLADASLIEPIAVQAGLWRWFEPGLFAVPPIGILGWSFFALLCMTVFERERAPDWLAVPVAGAVVHLMLLAAWWGAFRWLNGEVAAWPVVAGAWAVSLAVAARAWVIGAGARVPLVDLLLRVPGAAFFFVLLAVYGAGDHGAALVAYALAFAPPYLVLTWQAARAAPASGPAPVS